MITAKAVLAGLGVRPAKFYEWERRFGRPNTHNGRTPRWFWVGQDEKDRIVQFYREHPLDGYRRCAYMMIDQDVAYCSPSTVYRILDDAGALRRWSRQPSRKGGGFQQPAKAHEHWHIDISYVNIAGTFYYLTTILDGYSRYIVHWQISESMTEGDVQLVLQRAKELYPSAQPRLISDNGKQFIAKDFKELIRLHGMTHVRTSPYYPQSNGKLERWHQSVKGDCIRPNCPLTLEDAIRLVGAYVEEYNRQRLHSAIGYVTPADKLAGRSEAIHAERDRKLEAARKARRERQTENSVA